MIMIIIVWNKQLFLLCSTYENARDTRKAVLSPTDEWFTWEKNSRKASDIS